MILRYRQDRTNLSPEMRYPILPQQEVRTTNQVENGCQLWILDSLWITCQRLAVDRIDIEVSRNGSRRNPKTSQTAHLQANRVLALHLSANDCRKLMATHRSKESKDPRSKTRSVGYASPQRSKQYKVLDTKTKAQKPWHPLSVSNNRRNSSVKKRESESLRVTKSLRLT